MQKMTLACTLAALYLSFGCAAPRKSVLSAPGIGPYSSAVLSGDFVFMSGKIGERGVSFEHEATTAIDAVEGELQRIGLGLGDVVTATVFLTDMDRYAEFNAIYAARFPRPFPARACVAVAQLPAGAQVEIQVTARR